MRLALLAGIVVALGVGAALVVRAVVERPGCAVRRADWDRARRPTAGRIVRCRTLIGASRERAQRLLGPPDERVGAEWIYALGERQTLLPLDAEHLALRFAAGRVASATLLTD